MNLQLRTVVVNALTKGVRAVHNVFNPQALYNRVGVVRENRVQPTKVQSCGKGQQFRAPSGNQKESTVKAVVEGGSASKEPGPWVQYSGKRRLTCGVRERERSVNCKPAVISRPPEVRCGGVGKALNGRLLNCVRQRTRQRWGQCTNARQQLCPGAWQCNRSGNGRYCANRIQKVLRMS